MPSLLAKAQGATDPSEASIKSKAHQADQHDRNNHAGDLKIVPLVPDEVADTALGANHLRGDDHEPRDTDGNTHSGHDHGYTCRQHDSRHVLEGIKAEYA